MSSEAQRKRNIHGIRIYPNSITTLQGQDAPILVHGNVQNGVSDFFYIFRCMTPMLANHFVADNTSGQYDFINQSDEGFIQSFDARSPVVAADHGGQLVILDGSRFINWGPKRYNCQGAFLPVFRELPDFDLVRSVFDGNDKALQAGLWPGSLRGFFYMWDDIYWEFYSVERADIHRLAAVHGDDKALTLWEVDIALDYPEPRDVSLKRARPSETTQANDQAPIYQYQRTNITDDFDSDECWIGESSGDIFIDGEVLGCYKGWWRPNLDLPAYLVIEVVNSRLELECALCVELVRDTELRITPIEQDRLPWGVGTFGDYLQPQDISSYTKAARALALVPDIVGNDRGLAKYLLDSTISVVL